MKRLLSIFISIIMLMSVAACSKNVGTWQEHYDLGMRYLSEGNYKEAIITFNVAIEIDEKQVDAYIGLADAYIAQGDTEKAIEALEKGYKVTKSDVLNEKIMDVSLNEYGATKFELRKFFKDYESITEEEKKLLDDAISLAETGDCYGLVELLRHGRDNYGYSYLAGGTPVKNYFLSTIKDGQKIDLRMYTNGHSTRGNEYDYVVLEIRSENEDGNYYEASAGDDGYEKLLSMSCQCVDWQWNGEVTGIETEIVPDKHFEGESDLHEISQKGFMKDNLREGLTSEIWEHSTSKFGHLSTIISEVVFSKGNATERISYEEGEDANIDVVEFSNLGIGDILSYASYNVRNENKDVWW